jgi:hypothetical protein
LAGTALIGRGRLPETPPTAPVDPADGRREHPARRFLPRLAYGIVLLVSTGLLLLLLELGASFFVELPAASVVSDARLNHTWPPNTSAEHGEWAADNPEFAEPYLHRYNAQGWIETYDVALVKPPGTWRIFYVGDSFTEGCVPMDESVASRVERHLNERLGGGGTRFEVVNTGTASYSPLIYYILIRYFIQSYSPDAIVVNVDMTDPYDDWKYRETLITDADGNPYAVPPRDLYSSPYVDTLRGAVRTGFFPRLSLFLAEKSHLYNLIRRMPAASQPTEPVEAGLEGDDAQLLVKRWGWCRYEWDEATRRNVAFTTDVLRRIARYCNEHGIRLLLTGVPHYQQFELESSGRPRWSSRPHEEIRRIAEEEGVAYLDSYQSLAPRLLGSRQSDFYYAGNMHFNPRGNALWAEAQIRAFVDGRNRLLPETAYLPVK